MNQMKIQKRAYREIWKDGRTHQEVYDTIRNEIQESPEELATIISAIPSPKRNQKKRGLWLVYALTLFDVAGLRIYALMETPADQSSNFGYLIPTVLFGVLIPLYGVWGATRANLMSYGWTGISLLTTLVLLFAQTQYVDDTIVYITAASTVLGMVFAGMVPRLLKGKYDKTVEKTEVDGKTKSRLIITFREDN